MLEYILQVIASGVGIWCFAVTFNAPKKEYLYCAINGAVSWLMYLVFCWLGAGVTLACICASFAITLLARVFSALRKHPVTVYLISAIVNDSMIVHSPIFWTFLGLGMATGMNDDT